MILGFPASGKSSLSQTFIDNGFYHLNRDKEGGSIVDLLPKLEQCLKDGNDVVLDNLFPTIEKRKPFIDLCKKYNIGIECKIMSTSIEDAQFNFVQRIISLTGKFPSLEEIKKSKHPNIFPPTVLFKYKKEFQLPTVEEGFWRVQVAKFERQEDPAFINKAIITDYDGTLRDCIGGNEKYPTDISHIKIKPNCKKVLQSYKDKGYLLLGVSNQSGVHKGELPYDKCVELFDYTNQQLGLDIEYKFCPHQSAPISCYCRKPQIGFFVEFMMKHKLSRKDCIYVGDLTTDATFAKRSGIEFVHESIFFK